MTKRIILISLFSAISLSGGDVSMAAENATHWGFWTIVPPLAAIILAFITKNVIASLFIGIFSGAYIISLNEHSLFSSFFHAFLKLTQEAQSAIADTWNAGVLLQTLTIGGLIALVSKMGGAKAIAEALAKRAKSPRTAQIYTWMMGIFIFFDDYANTLTVGPIMRPVTDKMKISRERLSFIIDATAAPIAGIALISTWVGYEIGLIRDAYSIIDTPVNPYAAFVATIPYLYYNIFMLVFVFASAWHLREFGPMYAAEKRAQLEGKLYRDGANLMSDIDSQGLDPESATTLRISNAVIPILTLIFGAFIGLFYDGYRTILNGENLQLAEQIQMAPFAFASIRASFSNGNASIVLFQAALLGSIVAISMGIIQKIFTIEEALKVWLAGAKMLLITAVILTLAWSLSGIVKELGTATWLISTLGASIPPYLLSTIIFILGAVISFATGTSYGTMGILMPLAIPMAYALNPDPLFMSINIGAVLTGAIFGDHCSPISDTTILSSMGASCDHIDHTRTQIFYAVTIALIAILFGHLPLNLGVPGWLVLLLGFVLVFFLPRIFGKSVDMKMIE